MLIKSSLGFQTMMMGTEMVLETSVIFKLLTRLIAREDFINLAAVKASDLTTSNVDKISPPPIFFNYVVQTN
jgi:hypothetical protein